LSENTLNERIWLWRNSIEMVKRHPISGVGLGQWCIEFPRYSQTRKFRNSRELSFLRPHNDYLWVLSEAGMPGLALYVAIFLVTIFYCLKIWFQGKDTDTRYSALFMLFGLIGYMVIAFFSFPKERIVHNIFFHIIMACVVSGYYRSFPANRRAYKTLPVTFNTILLVLAAGCVIVGYSRLNSEIHVKLAWKAYQKEDWPTVISETSNADTVFYRLDPVATPLIWYRGVAYYSMGQYVKALEDLKSAYRLHTNHIHVLNNLGTGYAAVGDYQEAAKFYKKALNLVPSFEDARINLGIIYFHSGMMEEARRSLVLCAESEDPRVETYLNRLQNLNTSSG